MRSDPKCPELVNSELHLPYYPFMFQLSDGKVVYGGSAWAITDPTEDIPKTLDPIVSQWTDLVTSPISPPAGRSNDMASAERERTGIRCCNVFSNLV